MFQDEETGAWYQHKGRDFKVPLVDDVPDNGNLIGAKKGFGKWPFFYIYIFVNSFYYCPDYRFCIPIVRHSFTSSFFFNDV